MNKTINLLQISMLASVLVSLGRRFSYALAAWLAGCLTWLSLPIFLPSRGPMIYVLGLFQLQQACNFYCKNMKCSFTTSKKAQLLVFKTAFGFAVRCLDSSQFQLIDLSHSTAGSL